MYFRTRNPKGLTESGTGELGIIVCGRTSTGQVGLCFLWFFVQELLEAHSAVVMVLKHLRRRGKKLFVAFPWVETSTGLGGFMICVFYYMTGTPEGSTESGFMEKPGIEPTTPGLQGIALIYYTTGGASQRQGKWLEA